MSLINQMLRDLEQRNPQKSATQALAPQTPPLVKRQNRLGLWLLGVPMLALIYFWQIDNKSTTRAVVPAPAPIVVSNTPQPATAPSHASVSEPAAVVEQNIASKPLELSAPPPSAVEQAAAPEEATMLATATGSSSTAMQSEPKALAPKPVGQLSQARHRPATRHPMTQADQAEALYKGAQRAASIPLVKDFLTQALALDPYHRGARTLLLQTLLKAHAPNDEISHFAQESLGFFPGDPLFSKTQAHIYLQQKRFDAAATILESLPADTLDDPAYMSLLAASYQQLQRFQQAERLYQRLTLLQTDKAEHWLGLAICQEKLGKSQAAAQSYQEALDKNSLNPEVVDYIKQRLSSIN